MSAHKSTKKVTLSLPAVAIIVTLILATIGGAYKMGTIKFDHDKIKLSEQNKKLNEQCEVYRLKTNDLQVQLDECRQVSEKPNVPKPEPQISTPKPKTSTLKPKNQTQTTTNFHRNDHTFQAEINSLKNEKQKLVERLNLIGAENADLRRKLQNKINEIASFINEIEILQNELNNPVLSKKERAETTEKMDSILTEAKHQNLNFEESEAGKLSKKIVDSLNDEQRNLEKKIKDLTTKHYENIEEKYADAIKTLDKARQIKKRSNRAIKCELILQVSETFDELTKEGKICDTEKRRLKEEFPKCFR